MAVADDLQDLNNDIWDAYSAIDGKGGTLPRNKNTNNLVTAIESIPSGGGGVAKPTTWAELKAMNTTSLQQIFPEGSVIDSIECKWTGTNNTTVYDVEWVVASYGTCQLENDSTDYPCVTLLAKRGFPTSMVFDAQEKVQCDSTTELTAEDGVYYYGTRTASGNIAANNTTALNLTTGDTIPYANYARIFKSSVNATATDFVSVWLNGYNNYRFSNIRQWLNSAATDTNWFAPTHVGDVKASGYNNHRGFQSGFTSDFLSVVSPTKINVIANTVTDSGADEVMHDKFFLPSWKEVGFTNPPAEGDMFGGIEDPGDRCKYYLVNGNIMPVNNAADVWWLRSPNWASSGNGYGVTNNGVYTSYASYSSLRAVPACSIILASQDTIASGSTGSGSNSGGPNSGEPGSGESGEGAPEPNEPIGEEAPEPDEPIGEGGGE